MADGRTRSRKASPLWHSLCDEHGTDDGVDPRLFFGRTHQSENHRAKRLCVAARRALALGLAPLLGEAGRSLAVESVEPPAARRPPRRRASRPSARTDERRRLSGALESAEARFWPSPAGPSSAGGPLTSHSWCSGSRSAAHEQREGRFEAWLPGPLDLPRGRPSTGCGDGGRARRRDHAHAHLAGEVCVGTVVATRSTLLPEAIGGDIGCGVLAQRFDGEAAVLGSECVAARIMAGLYQMVPEVRHVRRRVLPERLARAEPEGLARRGAGAPGRYPARDARPRQPLRRAPGSDEDAPAWVAVHTGSRAFGQAVLELTSRRRRDRNRTSPPRCRHARRRALPSGHGGGPRLRGRQPADHHGGGCRAPEHGAEVCARLDREISCVHNFVRREPHGGAELWVHRKGAISAAAASPESYPARWGRPPSTSTAADASGPSARAPTGPAVP